MQSLLGGFKAEPLPSCSGALGAMAVSIPATVAAHETAPLPAKPARIQRIPRERGAGAFHAQHLVAGIVPVLAAQARRERREQRAAARRAGPDAAEGMPGSPGSPGAGGLTKAKQRSQPDRQKALAMSMYGQKILGADKTVPDVVPEELLKGDFGKELEACMEAMVEILHMLCLGTLILEDVKDKSTVGLYGFQLEDKYVREDTTMPGAAVTCYVMKMLKEKFPDDPIICDQNPELLANDARFAETVASFLSNFDMIPEADAASVTEWHRLCQSYPQDAEEVPRRYWVFNPVDTGGEFRDAKQFCSTLCLMQDGAPVVSVMGCPMLSFDHPSRTTSHPSGSSIFYAVKGQGAWTQCVIMERKTGIYLGRYGLKGKSLKLDVSQKIKRGNDGLYDMLGTEQLRIAQHARMRQDIFLDSERIAKLLGSEFAKFHFINNSIKFCWLARGDED